MSFDRLRHLKPALQVGCGNRRHDATSSTAIFTTISASTIINVLVRDILRCIPNLRISPSICCPRMVQNSRGASLGCACRQRVSRHTNSSWMSILLTQLRSLSIKYITIDPTPSSPATFSQLVRLFAFKLPDILPPDYVVASDRCSVKFCLAMNGRISQCSQRYSAFAA